MVEIVILCVLAVIMGEIYVRTRRPKLYAFLNTAIGTGSLMAVQFLMNGTVEINNINGAVSGILGIPGTVLCSLLQIGG